MVGKLRLWSWNSRKRLKMRNKEFIVTASDFDKNTTSKRKGDAFESLAWIILFKSGSLSIEKQQTIEKAIESYAKKFCRVRRNFALMQNGASRNFSRDFRNGDIIFRKDSVGAKQEIKLRCIKENKSAEIIFGDKEQLADYLIREGFVSEIKAPAIVKKYRTDACKLEDGRICIIEWKNKEKSCLRKRDLSQIVTYGRIIKECVPLGEIKIVVNGYSKDWGEEIKSIKSDYGLEISVCSIKSWLVKFAELTGKQIDCLVYSKISLSGQGFEPVRIWKRSKFYLNVRTTAYNGPSSYGKIPLIISDDVNRVKNLIKS